MYLLCCSGSEFQYSLLNHLTNLAQFPRTLQPLADPALQLTLDTLGREVAALMRTVSPDCSRMSLVCRLAAILYCCITPAGVKVAWRVPRLLPNVHQHQD